MVSIKTINDIAFITIKNKANLRLVLSSLGASIFAIYFNDELMTLSLANEEDYLNPDLYHGKTIGPVCGRIANGQIGNYHYDLNEENVTRHGGKNGLSTQVFNYEVIENSDSVSIVFSLNGFSITYEINQNKDFFLIKFLYDGNSQPVALSNHTFFHLGGSFNDLRLKLSIDYFIENDPITLVPLNQRSIIPCLDFNNGKKLSESVDDPYLMDSRTKGYDHYLHFAKERIVELFNSRYLLDITTDFDGVLIYSDNYDFKEKTLDNRTGTRRALAVEPQDSPLERKIYGKENNYHRFIKYYFSKV